MSEREKQELKTDLRHMLILISALSLYTMLFLQWGCYKKTPEKSVLYYYCKGPEDKDWRLCDERDVPKKGEVVIHQNKPDGRADYPENRVQP